MVKLRLASIIIEQILRVLTLIVGMIALDWGFPIGVLGKGPEGPVPDSIRLLGIYVFVYGITCMSTSILSKCNFILRLFIATPFLALLVWVLQNITDEGIRIISEEVWLKLIYTMIPIIWSRWMYYNSRVAG